MFKTRLDTFGNNFGHFRNFENFLIILKIFEDSTLHGTLGKSFVFEKNYTKTCSKHVWTLLGTILGIFGFLKIFLIFLKIFEDSLDRPWNTGQKFFSKKSPENMFKTRLDTFGNDFGHFRNFENFLIFLKIFEDSTVHGTLGKKLFSKKSPENMFKTRLDTFGNDFGHFRNFEKFLIFLKNFDDSTLHGTLGKSFLFEKNTPKHVQNTFGHFWERFWALLDF